MAAQEHAAIKPTGTNRDIICFGCHAVFNTQADVYLHLPTCPRPHKTNPIHSGHFSKTGQTTRTERQENPAIELSKLQKVHETIVGGGTSAQCRYCDKTMSAKNYWAKHVTHCPMAYCILCSTAKHSKFGCPTKLFCTICNQPGHFKGTHRFFV